MYAFKAKGKKGNLIIKTWERCKSIGSKRSEAAPSGGPGLKAKSKSWPRMDVGRGRLTDDDDDDDGDRKKEKRSRKKRVAPDGCLSVYVGPEKHKFVIKTEYVNHPLFKLLLEEAESEYGFYSEGPLVLPCKVDVFYKVLLAMDDHDHHHGRQGCAFPKSRGSYRLLISPPRLVAVDHF